MVDKKTTDKQSEVNAPVAKSTSDSAAGKKKSTAKVAARPATKPVVKSAATKNSKDALATIEKAGASKDSDMKSAAKKISAADKKLADNTIKSKKDVEDLKARAHEAKQRAQQKILEKAYVSDKPTDPLERLANTFDSSARRWEMVVYPSLFAFVLLAGYGFFLIYRLTHDIAILSQSVTHMAVIVSDAMPRMTKDLNTMTGSIDDMSTEVTSMSGQMNSLTPMSKNIQSMTHNIGNMNQSVYGMQRDMHGMNRTVSSGPFGMMNDMMPMSSNTNVPPSMPPSQTWPSYNPVPRQTYAAPNRRPVAQVPVKKVTPKTLPQKKVVTEVIMPGASPVSIKD